MPKLTLVGRNVCGHPSPFMLNAFIKKPGGITAPDGTVLIELDAELEHVLQIESPSVDAGETFTYERRVDTINLRQAQWATIPSLAGRFELISLTWGEHRLIRKPGLLM